MEIVTRIIREGIKNFGGEEYLKQSVLVIDERYEIKDINDLRNHEVMESFFFSITNNEKKLRCGEKISVADLLETN